MTTSPEASEDPRAASARWWARVKHDPEALLAWLFDQYRGEATASGRIRALRDAYAEAGTRAHRVLGVIAEQEDKHALWIGALLEARGVRAEIRDEEERYWPEVLREIADLETGAAAGAHAERMRLARIETIAADPDAPTDVRAAFQRILPEERFHERAFRAIAGDRALTATADAHRNGARALGLVP